MELFDKKFVHFMWDDELQGKKCFVSDGIDMLKEYVEHDESNMRLEVAKGHGNRPFAVDWTDDSLSDEYQFAYYDPNYDTKRAYYKGGKKVQAKKIDSFASWLDCDTPYWSKEYCYRVKPERKVIVAKRCSNCVHEHCSATKEPCVSCKPEDSKYEVKLCKTCEHFDNEVDVEPCDSCIDDSNAPNWEPKKKKEKKWRPYESSAEMICDFIDRFKVNCPSYCEPLIWVKGKVNDNRFLLTGFFPEIGVRTLEDGHSSFNALFSYYTYLDGSPVGMEVKE